MFKTKDKEENKFLHVCLNNDIIECKEMLQFVPQCNLDKKYKMNKTIFIIMCENNYTHIAIEILKHIDNKNIKHIDNQGNNAFLYACLNKIK